MIMSCFPHANVLFCISVCMSYSFCFVPHECLLHFFLGYPEHQFLYSPFRRLVFFLVLLFTQTKFLLPYVLLSLMKSSSPWDLAVLTLFLFLCFMAYMFLLPSLSDIPFIQNFTWEAVPHSVNPRTVLYNFPL